MENTMELSEDIMQPFFDSVFSKLEALSVQVGSILTRLGTVDEDIKSIKPHTVQITKVELEVSQIKEQIREIKGEIEDAKTQRENEIKENKIQAEKERKYKTGVLISIIGLLISACAIMVSLIIKR